MINSKSLARNTLISLCAILSAIDITLAVRSFAQIGDNFKNTNELERNIEAVNYLMCSLTAICLARFIYCIFENKSFFPCLVNEESEINNHNNINYSRMNISGMV